MRPDHLGFDEFDVVAQGLVLHHYRVTDGRLEAYSMPFRYVWPAELDLMARLAGMTLRERWSGWDREPFTSESTAHVSVWEKPGAAPRHLTPSRRPPQGRTAAQASDRAAASSRTAPGQSRPRCRAAARRQRDPSHAAASAVPTPTAVAAAAALSPAGSCCRGPGSPGRGGHRRRATTWPVTPAIRTRPASPRGASRSGCAGQLVGRPAPPSAPKAASAFTQLRRSVRSGCVAAAAGVVSVSAASP